MTKVSSFSRRSNLQIFYITYVPYILYNNKFLHYNLVATFLLPKTYFKKGESLTQNLPWEACLVISPLPLTRDPISMKHCIKQAIQ